MKFLFLSFLFLSGSLLGCQYGKKGSRAYQPPETILMTDFPIGNWQWIKTSCCGRNAQWQNPSTEQEHRTLLLMKDGTYRLQTKSLQDKPLKTIHGTYIISKPFLDDHPAGLQLDNQRPAILQREGDTLILNYGYIDLQIEYYIPIR